jgi:hypothetical protein
MNNELFTVRPSLKQYYGRTVTKELEFEEATESGEVKQTLKDLVLTTITEKEWEVQGIKNTLKSTQTEELTEGTIIIWDEQNGYIVPNVPMYKLHDLEKEIEQIKDIYKDNTDINPKE